eukprot:Plantae.Rhodophyta-Hildenbrandia_rubra.ctg13829.p1 GENE.Plantae.Rhodophyta-Hildenbrandia_rubra.ctg13829~~Plantae.Rhodophyta-Hildenbrandia_rubra.ctg13829.p1  ORF type:complete len:561 (+),score=116.22 Plantae.Rhodophyta-Hildenbrandia_rubra.ctg13829:148-1830(+)
MSGDAGFVGAEVEGQVLQLVDARGEFHQDALQSLADQIGDDESDYKVVSVLGARGSGRSTLMNRLFGTTFEVGRPFSGRGTRGCWGSVAGGSALSTEGEGGNQDAENTAKKVLVLDTQGADGRDGDGEKVAKVVNLTLNLADVLIFNVWAADLGRYEAAGYGLLRSVLAEYLKSYPDANSRARTLIFFVIRDHDDGSPLDDLKTLIMKDVEGLWDQLDKPESDADLADFFDFEFFSFPHIRHRKAEFKDAAETMRRKLLDPQDSILKSEYSKNVPADSLATFGGIAWDSVDKDSEIELPGRKDLIAAYRCDVAFDSQLRPGLTQLNRWTAEVDRGRTISNFGSKASELLENALENYDADTSSHATASVRSKKRSELQSSLQARIRFLFNKQMMLLQNQALQKFKEKLLNNVADGDTINDFETQQALRTVDEWFSRKAEELLVGSMRLSFRSARLEVQNALQTFGENFKSSPTAQLQAMKHMERQAMRPPPRKRKVEFGLGVNVACRPAGFGNFQLVTGYSRGPHSLQATVVNDRDAAEQEGQGQVPLFRIQPTINTTVDL